MNKPAKPCGGKIKMKKQKAEGITIVDDIQYIERGYEDLDRKLRELGASIEKVSSEKELQKFILKVS